MREVKRFKCDHCGKLLAKEDAMTRHESECVHNPKSVNCYRCKFACISDWEVYNNYDDSNRTIKDMPVCTYRDEIITENLASECSMFRLSDKGNYERDYEEAEKNYYLEKEEEQPK